MTVPLIQFIDVMKDFDTFQVLRGLNLSIYSGEITVVIGKSGTGKSVLLKHIIGLIRQDSGKILISGESLHKLSTEKIQSFQKQLSYMFQDNALFDFLNIYDNIALPLVENSKFQKSLVKEKVVSLMEQLGLTNSEKKFPSQLSGGMRKRVAFARALITDPKIVLFDEPTTGLDPVRKKKVYSMIQEYQDKFGFTAVIVSHDIPDIFDIAQRIAMLDGGVIKFEGTKKDILESHSKTLNTFIKGENI